MSWWFALLLLVLREREVMGRCTEAGSGAPSGGFRNRLGESVKRRPINAVAFAHSGHRDKAGQE